MAISEDGMRSFKLSIQVFDFFKGQVSVSIVYDFGAPVASKFKVNLTTRLLPYQDMTGTRSKPQKTLGAVEPSAQFTTTRIM